MPVTFFRGHPSNDLLPRKEILAAATNVLGTPQSTDDDEETRHPLTYGSDPGALEVRRSIAKWNNRKRNNCNAPLTADCINLTNGASFGAATALLQCCPADYTKMAFAVSPTYFLINQILVDAGFKGRMKAIVETESGIDLIGFERLLKQIHDDKEVATDPLKFRYVLYIVPVYSNPGSYTTTIEENRILLELARKFNILILCDQVYDYLDYGNSSYPLTTLVDMDRETLPKNSLGNVIANCSFSKYLGPGLRVGWQECATPKLAYHLSQSGANKSGGSPSHLNTFIVKEIIDSQQIDIILSRLNITYGKRAESYLKAMHNYLPKGTKIIGGKGGYFFWVTFPPEYDVQAISMKCANHGIKLAPGQNFEVLGDEKGWGQHCYRVSLSYHDTDEATEAINLWGQISQSHKTEL